jgi:hypothetical protein
MSRSVQFSSSVLAGLVLALTSFSIVSASAQSGVSPLLEKLRPCLSKGFNLEADCPIGNYCHVLRGGSGFGDFPAKTALAAAKLKEMWGCFDICSSRGCFSGVRIENIEPIESTDEQSNRKSTEIGAKIVGTADLSVKTHFECDLKAITSVSMGKSAGTSNSVMCSTR